MIYFIRRILNIYLDLISSYYIDKHLLIRNLVRFGTLFPSEEDFENSSIIYVFFIFTPYFLIFQNYIKFKKKWNYQNSERLHCTT